MAFKVSVKENAKLKELVQIVNEDQELQQLWVCANVNAMKRAGISDHGPVHIQIVANACLRLLRLLVEAQVMPSLVEDYGMQVEDAEVVVTAAACLHDIGISVHRDDHEHFSLILAYPKARQLLSKIYEEPQLTIMVSEVLHTVISHRWDIRGLSVESGVLKVADALDMTEGRSRIPFESGDVNIHSVSAQAVEGVTIRKGKERPVQVDINLNNSAGIFQVDELLKRKLKNSTLAPFVEVVAHLDTDKERRLLDVHRF